MKLKLVLISCICFLLFAACAENNSNAPANSTAKDTGAGNVKTGVKPAPGKVSASVTRTAPLTVRNVDSKTLVPDT